MDTISTGLTQSWYPQGLSTSLKSGVAVDNSSYAASLNLLDSGLLSLHGSSSTSDDSSNRDDANGSDTHSVDDPDVDIFGAPDSYEADLDDSDDDGSVGLYANRFANLFSSHSYQSLAA